MSRHYPGDRVSPTFHAANKQLVDDSHRRKRSRHRKSRFAPIYLETIALIAKKWMSSISIADIAPLLFLLFSQSFLFIEEKDERKKCVTGDRKSVCMVPTCYVTARFGRQHLLTRRDKCPHITCVSCVRREGAAFDRSCDCFLVIFPPAAP